MSPDPGRGGCTAVGSSSPTLPPSCILQDGSAWCLELLVLVLLPCFFGGVVSVEASESGGRHKRCSSLHHAGARVSGVMDGLQGGDITDEECEPATCKQKFFFASPQHLLKHMMRNVRAAKVHQRLGVEDNEGRISV